MGFPQLQGDQRAICCQVRDGVPLAVQREGRGHNYPRKATGIGERTERKRLQPAPGKIIIPIDRESTMAGEAADRMIAIVDVDPSGHRSEIPAYETKTIPSPDIWDAIRREYFKSQRIAGEGLRKTTQWAGH